MRNKDISDEICHIRVSGNKLLNTDLKDYTERKSKSKYLPTKYNKVYFFFLNKIFIKK